MKKFFAALTAVALTTGLSLAAAAGPATADATPTPSPTSTPTSGTNRTPTSTATPAATPSPTPTATPTSTPSSVPTPTPTPTQSPAPATAVPAPVASEFAVSTTNVNATVLATSFPTVYETIVWSMASGSAVTITDGSATYPQTGVAQYKGETSENLNVAYPTTCGVSYQIDVYVQIFGPDPYHLTDNTAALDHLYSIGLAGPNGAQDGPYLAGNGSNPGAGGLGYAWKYVTNKPCLPTVVPVAPTATAIVTCGDTGSVDITPTPNVDYYVNGVQATAGLTVIDAALETGLSGSVDVSAIAESGFTFGSAVHDWTFALGAVTTCSVGSVLGACVPTNGVSNESVTLTFTNPSSNPAPVTITGPAGFTPVSFSATPGTSQYVIGAASSGDVYGITINGVAQPNLAVSFAACPLTIKPGDPSATPATCNGLGTNNDASIKLDLETGLSYEITGPNGYDQKNITGTGGPTVVATGLTGGDYTVTVVAINGYALDPSIGAPTWPFDLPIPNPYCNFGASAQAVVCEQTDVAPGHFIADLAGVPTITVLLDPNVVYTAVNTTDNTSFVLTQAVTNITDPGVYNVVVSLAAGSTFVLPVGGVTFGPFDLESFCPPTEATWNANVASTPATCTATAATKGGIDLQHDANQAGEVIYTVKDSSNAIVYTGSNTAATDGVDTIVNVGPGTYTVTATPLNPADGLSGNGSTTGNVMSWSVVITTDGIDCNGNLAFTGGTVAWLGFIVAGGMLFLGFALLYIRRRGNRTAE